MCVNIDVKMGEAVKKFMEFYGLEKRIVDAVNKKVLDHDALLAALKNQMRAAGVRFDGSEAERSRNVKVRIFATSTACTRTNARWNQFLEAVAGAPSRLSDRPASSRSSVPEPTQPSTKVDQNTQTCPLPPNTVGHEFVEVCDTDVELLPADAETPASRLAASGNHAPPNGASSPNRSSTNQHCNPAITELRGNRPSTSQVSSTTRSPLRQVITAPPVQEAEDEYENFIGAIDDYA